MSGGEGAVWERQILEWRKAGFIVRRGPSFSIILSIQGRVRLSKALLSLINLRACVAFSLYGCSMFKRSASGRLSGLRKRRDAMARESRIEARVHCFASCLSIHPHLRIFLSRASEWQGLTSQTRPAVLQLKFRHQKTAAMRNAPRPPNPHPPKTMQPLLPRPPPHPSPPRQ